MPGGAFAGATAVLARQANGQEEVVLSEVVAGEVVQEVIRTQPTSQGRLFRPMPPDNGGPLWCWLVNITDYPNEFYEWSSSLTAVERG